MRLGEALQINGRLAAGRQHGVHLLCGFQPLHLETFVKAHIRLRFPDENALVHTDLFDDLEGNIIRARSCADAGAIIAIEWADLDARLSLRSASAWNYATLANVVEQVREKCSRLVTSIIALSEVMPVAVMAPTLPLPPISHLPPSEAGLFDLELNAILLQLCLQIASSKGVRICNAALLSAKSPAALRQDVKMELLAGFPYSVSHAAAVAALSVDCLFPAIPKKGLITDLDGTLWKGILGDVGIDGITWSLESKSQAHALYQRALGSLADSGVLLAIASKNDSDMVASALERPDLLVNPSCFFPVEANWGPKSESIARILKAWNVGEDSVIFVDDSSMELAEVEGRFPKIECLLFPSEDSAGVLSLIETLRTRLGKREVRQEDRLRLQSLRSFAKIENDRQIAGSSGDFVARLEAKVTMEASEDDPRPFELVNKTNQFNLNGVRFTEAEWKRRRFTPGMFTLSISYEDRFGPLGRIAVVGGETDGKRCLVDTWVISCRAFSRQIEYQIIRQLFLMWELPEIHFLYQKTKHNGPTRTFFEQFLPTDLNESGKLVLPASVFNQHCPELFHQVDNQWIMSHAN